MSLLSMNLLDYVALVIVIICFVGLVLYQEKLTTRKNFFKAFLIATALIVIGVLYLTFSNSPGKELIFVLCQTSMIFLLLYQVIRILYRLLLNREPEISKSPEHWLDIIPSIILLLGAIILPLFSTLLIQKFWRLLF
jgi:hypothetical protein